MLNQPTIKETLLWTIRSLKTKNILSAQLDAEILLAHLLKKSKEFLYIYPEYEITKNQELRIKNYARRRLKGEPMAYILGHKEFYSLNFKVNKNVLIPRAETELLVEEIINFTTHNLQPTTFIDIGVGSGCIIIALAKELLNKELGIRNYEFWGIDLSKKALGVARQNARLHNVDKKIKFIQGNLIEPILYNSKFLISARGGSAFGGKYGMTNIEFYAIDNSKKALAVAQKNAQFHGVGKQIKFLKGDLLKPLIKKLSVVSSQLSVVIVANLPYLTSRQYQQNHELRFEPRSALVGGDDGLKYIKLFLQQLAKLVPQVKTITAYLEIDPYQAKKVKKLVNLYLPKSSFQIKKDLSGQNRLAIIKC